MRYSRGIVGSLVLLGMLTGCFTGRKRPVEAGGRYLITQAELDAVAANSMYDAVLKLRPHFLRNRTITAEGRGASRQLMLYVDGERMESLDDLRRLVPAEVLEVRFYEPQLANTYFARYNNAAGAIAITLRKLDGP
jgi:hypothetical protein